MEIFVKQAISTTTATMIKSEPSWKRLHANPLTRRGIYISSQSFRVWSAKGFNTLSTPNPKATFMYPSGWPKEPPSVCLTYGFFSMDAHKHTAKCPHKEAVCWKRWLQWMGNETINIIVLYPQSAVAFPDNPNAYFDWLEGIW